MGGVYPAPPHPAEIIRQSASPATDNHPQGRHSYPMSITACLVAAGFFGMAFLLLIAICALQSRRPLRRHHYVRTSKYQHRVP